MKVLQINSVCGIRSTGRICADLAEVLDSVGHECKIAYGRDSVPEKYQKYAHRTNSEWGVKTDVFLSRLLDNAGFNSKRATKRLINRIKEYDPDVIHLHNLHGYYINIPLLFDFLAEFNKPVVWTLHDCWAFTGHCSYFTSVKCEKWKTGCYGCTKKRAYPSSLFIDNSKRNYQKKKQMFTSLKNLTLITPSEWLAGMVRESFLGGYEIRVVPNGVDLEKFKPTPSNFKERYGIEGKKIVLGVATAWSERKGLNDFIKLSEILPDDYKVVLVGLCGNQIDQLPDRILKISRTNSVEELAEIYTAADVFVNAGREETMGLTTVEAMACGTPAIVTNFTAVPEVVTPDGGIVLEDFSPETLLGAIHEITNSEYLKTRENALEYEKMKQFDKYVEIYERLVNIIEQKV